jgi:hypothetical protein
MNFLKKPRLIRRYSTPSNVKGYISIPFEEKTLPMDVQTSDDAVMTTADGSKSIQRLKVFCDFELLIENEQAQQKADRLWFHGKWFECRSSRLSENTPLRHYTATFIECLDQDDAPESENEPDGDLEVYLDEP